MTRHCSVPCLFRNNDQLLKLGMIEKLWEQNLDGKHAGDYFVSICSVYQFKENQSALSTGATLFVYLIIPKFQPPLSFIILGSIPCLTCTSFSVLGHKQKSHTNLKSGELLQRVVMYTYEMMMIRTYSVYFCLVL